MGWWKTRESTGALSPRTGISRLWKRPWFWGGLVVLPGIVFLGRPILHVAGTAWNDLEERQAPPAGYVDDASRLNLTQVREVWPVPVNRAEAETQLAGLLARARAEGLQVSIAGSRHSMGGHSLVPGGIVVDMTPFHSMKLDESRDVLHVQAGAKWSEVIAYLERHGRSVAVMQSNNSFTVGGSISVNCHGWQYGRPPIASTVNSFRLMRADGRIVTCSRDENPELFSLALGGYGLFGIILDVDVRVVPNERYRLEQSIVPIDEALPTFDSMVADPGVAMVYARMNIVPETFLEEVLINALYRDAAASGEIPKLEEPGLETIRRSIFRGSAQSDYGKQLRWEAETQLQPWLGKRYYSRNQLLNEGVEVFENRSADSTDILHEYFVPREGLAGFVAALQTIIPRHEGDLLNVTVRHVDVDDDTFLRYADRPLFSFVMLFHQQRSEEADRRMRAMTVELIEASLEAGGRYYLPYRLHATAQQFRRAYPQADEFFAQKRKYDPQGLFENRFSLKYGQPAGDLHAAQ